MPDPVKVAEGGYGCVFRPALECADNKLEYVKDGGYVSKVMSEKHADSELKEYAKIETADPGNKYHLEAPKKCKMAQIPVNLKSVKQCKVSEKISNIDLTLLQLKDGGESLKEFAKSNPSEREMENFLVDFHNILMALVLLQDKKLHHMDLKPHNIVYNKTQRLMLMIDFGLMESDASIIDFYQSRPISHWNYPPEVYFIRYHHMKPGANLSNPALFEFQSDNGTNHVIEYVEFNDAETMEYVNAYETNIKDNDINDIMDQSIATHDVFGAGISLLYVLRNNKNKISNTVFSVFDNIGKDMMHGSTAARLTPKKAISRYEMALESTGLLKSQNKKIVNNSIVPRGASKTSESQRLMSRLKEMRRFTEEQLDKITTANVPTQRDCPEGKELVGSRCYKTCVDGKVRNPATKRCVKNLDKVRARPGPRPISMRITAECPDGKERNPETGRCVKKCRPDQIRSVKTRRCIKRR